MTIDAPLEYTPVLVRGGGILVLGGQCTKNIYDGMDERTIQIFPVPSASNSLAGRRGSFTLVEDDGKSNDHTTKGNYTEMVISFEVVDETVVIEVEVVKGEYELGYEVLWFELPMDDEREMVGARGMSLVREGRRVGWKL
jgi:alpha-glucosidase